MIYVASTGWTIDRFAPLPVCPGTNKVPLHGDRPLAAFTQGTLSHLLGTSLLIGDPSDEEGRLSKTKSPGFSRTS
jgi:hypothetical protein